MHGCYCDTIICSNCADNFCFFLAGKVFCMSKQQSVQVQLIIVSGSGGWDVSGKQNCYSY